MSNTAKLQLGFSPLSKTIMLAKMRDVEGGRLRVGNDRGRDVTNEAAQLVWQLVMAEGGEIAWMLKKWGRERQEYDFAMSKFLHGENYADSYTRHMWKAWTESRAAMIQSKYRDLSQPVDPQISEYEKIMLRAGWVMVPVEPTDEMIAAAMNCEDVLFNSDESFCVQFGNIYEAMLAAAPQQEVK
ncbi:hypothetical protein D9O22_08650 [Salmonella enterica]|nr:hypothetical protein [Salmonella enterica]EBD6167563.1 hypothetical protein [Salmonella enterica]EBE5317953.1 hypothetical protein [Salmonella enterica]EBQ8616457.1 hypothetical protein [Salmonella enterica]EDS9488341.1 hypothetical protein [Salmonella enterica]